MDKYRLLDRKAERDLTLSTKKVLQTLQQLSDEERFDGSDPLTVFSFLEIKTTFEDAGLSEGDAIHVVC